MSVQGVLVEVVGLGEGEGCSCGGNCAPAGGSEKSEAEQVLALNVEVRKQRNDVKLQYCNYQRQAPPPALQQLIDDMHLELPVTFVGGNPAFQGGLPDVADLLEAIADFCE